jgi:hypothetical protein
MDVFVRLHFHIGYPNLNCLVPQALAQLGEYRESAGTEVEIRILLREVRGRRGREDLL